MLYFSDLEEDSDGEEPLQFKPVVDLERFRQFIESEQKRALTEEEQQRQRLTQSIADKKLMDMMNMKPGLCNYLNHYYGHL